MTTSPPTTDQPSPGPQRVAVVSASVRTERLSAPIADWVCDALRQAGAEVDLIDIAALTLPDDALLTPGGSGPTEVTDRVSSAEAFVFVTPEYNHSYPAALKHLLDWHFEEWMRKPATIVSYGAYGGIAATEHLRGVLAELSMVSTRRTVALAEPWQHLDAAGRFQRAGRALGLALAELGWWATVLTEARQNRSFPA